MDKHVYAKYFPKEPQPSGDVDTGKLASQFVFEANIPPGFCFEHPVGWTVELTGISRLAGTEAGRKIYSHEVRFVGPKCPLRNTTRFADMRYYYFLEKDKLPSV